MKKITINEIAEIAGVSKATVSRVLNNSKPVSDDIRKKVTDAIEVTNFVPSALGRGLSLNKSHLIGVIIPDLANPVFSRIIAGIESAIRHKDYALLITATDFSKENSIRHIQILHEKSVDGLIFLAGAMDQDLTQALENFSKPVVVIGSDIDSDLIPVVEIDNQLAAYEAVKYLMSIGHREIAMITGPMNDRYAGMERFKGFKKAMDEQGYYNDELVTQGRYAFKHGYGGMQEILSKKKLVTAVFCANDLMAIGAMKYCLDQGIKVPEDIAFMGFDDVDISKMYHPTLSTVRQPFEEKGRTAIELLMGLIRCKKVDSDKCQRENVILPHELVFRGSTKIRKEEGHE